MSPFTYPDSTSTYIVGHCLYQVPVRCVCVCVYSTFVTVFDRTQSE